MFYHVVLMTRLCQWVCEITAVPLSSQRPHQQHQTSSSMDSDAHHASVLPLDEGFYKPDSAFFKQQTGIDDDDELKAHLLSIQAEAYQVTHFLFTWPVSDSIMHAR